jgi:hypothetical protein
VFDFILSTVSFIGCCLACPPRRQFYALPLFLSLGALALSAAAYARRRVQQREDRFYAVFYLAAGAGANRPGVGAGTASLAATAGFWDLGTGVKVSVVLRALLGPAVGYIAAYNWALATLLAWGLWPLVSVLP